MTMFAVEVRSSHAQIMRQTLEDCGLWDDTRRLSKSSSGHVLIPVCDDVITMLPTYKCGDLNSSISRIPCPLSDLSLSPNQESAADQKTEIGHRPASSHSLAPLRLGGLDGTIVQAVLPLSKKSKLKNPHEELRVCLERSVTSSGVPWSQELDGDVPRHWECHGDLVLLPGSSFKGAVWRTLEGLWSEVARSLGCKRLARKSRILSDDYRTPAVEMLLGKDAWVQHMDNGVKYCYDITQCMFSAGNITEKIRVGAFRCEGEMVVDLFAGIGYFTLPYLVHAGAKFVHACEWNPHAVKALERNLELNGVQDRCEIHYGDNKMVCPRAIADRVNLGLIPSSESSWPVACQALRPSGGIMHVHGNVESPTSTTQESLRRPEESRLEELSLKGKNGGITNTKKEKTSQKCSKHDTLCSECGVHVVKEQSQSLCDELSDSHHLALGEKGISNLSTYQRSHSEIRADDAVVHTEQITRIDISTNKPIKDAWVRWAKYVEDKMRTLMEEAHKGSWDVRVYHIERVKSYAPHIDHLVADVRCKPMSSTQNHAN